MITLQSYWCSYDGLDVPLDKAAEHALVCTRPAKQPPAQGRPQRPETPEETAARHAAIHAYLEGRRGDTEQ